MLAGRVQRTTRTGPCAQTPALRSAELHGACDGTSVSAFTRSRWARWSRHWVSWWTTPSSRWRWWPWN